jgi:hypothetical protein
MARGHRVIAASPSLDLRRGQADLIRREAKKHAAFGPFFPLTLLDRSLTVI